MMKVSVVEHDEWLESFGDELGSEGTNFFENVELIEVATGLIGRFQVEAVNIVPPMPIEPFGRLKKAP